MALIPNAEWDEFLTPKNNGSLAGRNVHLPNPIQHRYAPCINASDRIWYSVKFAQTLSALFDISLQIAQKSLKIPEILGIAKAALSDAEINIKNLKLNTFDQTFQRGQRTYDNTEMFVNYQRGYYGWF